MPDRLKTGDLNSLASINRKIKKWTGPIATGSPTGEQVFSRYKLTGFKSLPWTGSYVNYSDLNGT